MKILFTTLCIIILSIHALAGEQYAVLEVRYTTEKISESAVDDVATYRWQTSEMASTGDLLELAKKLKIETVVKGGFSEFMLISGIISQGWSLRAAESTPAHFAHCNGLKFYRERKKILHFTKIPPETSANHQSEHGGEPNR